MGYRDFASAPLTGGDSIQQGAVGLNHLDAPLFQAVQNIKLHRHTGIDSQTLDAGATPYVVKALGPQNREEHNITSGAGNVVFNLPFRLAPTVIVGPLSSSAVYASNITTTGFTVNGGAAGWLAIGR